MKSQFVSYKIALQLKEKEYNEQCMRFYSSKNKGMLVLPERMNQMHNTQNSSVEIEGYCSAPLYSEVVDWFEEKHGIYIGKTGYDDGITPKRWVYHVNKQYCQEQSYEGAIKYALTLI